MKKVASLLAIVSLALIISSCGKQSGTEKISVPAGDPEVYLNVAGAVVSSFDDTPDWAPLPDPMAPFDRDMLTRWSPKLGLDNEWIYMDFGKEKVINRLVIKWERAYAPEYEVLCSDDAKKWSRVLLKKDGMGNEETLDFPAVKTRYVKIIGLKRANPEWGFSMWEIEPYGPKSLNPGEKVVDVTKVTAEKEEEGIEKMINEVKTPLTPAAKDEFQKGVCYTSWVYDELDGIASDKMLVHLKKMGVTHVAIIIPTYQEMITSENIYTNDKPGGDTPSDASIEHAIATCHKLGVKVLLKPHVDPRDNTPRIDIVASDKWFDSYEKMILRYAALAEKNKVEIFSVGTELEGTTFSRWEKRWRGVINKIKSVYSGLTVYSANWTEYKAVPFWDMVDFVGIDAYFPLTKKYDPAKEELIDAWEKIAAEIQSWLKEKNITKPVLFTEMGYTSSDGTNIQPWASITNVEDQDEQVDCIDAMSTVMTQQSYYRGGYLWQYLPQDRWSPLGFTIKGKKAEETLKAWYKK